MVRKWGVIRKWDVWSGSGCDQEVGVWSGSGVWSESNLNSKRV